MIYNSILTTVFKSKANWIGHIIKRNCVLHITKCNMYKRRKVQLLDNINGEKKRYWVDDVKDRTRWRWKFTSPRTCPIIKIIVVVVSPHTHSVCWTAIPSVCLRLILRQVDFRVRKQVCVSGMVCSPV